ncbi:hypothetical protein U1Q18_016157, partial [Sarracenia purpurea var. burkii]
MRRRSDPIRQIRKPDDGKPEGVNADSVADAVFPVSDFFRLRCRTSDILCAKNQGQEEQGCDL